VNLPCELNFQLNKLNEDEEEEKTKIIGRGTGFSFYFLAIYWVFESKKKTMGCCDSKARKENNFSNNVKMQ